MTKAGFETGNIINVSNVSLGDESWLNAIKGIGILSVVAGHIFTSGISKIIFIYHMPLLFFVSSYFFTPNELIVYIKRNVPKLLLPYLLYILFFFVLFVLKVILTDGFSGGYFILF
ncbi:acyltransferase family protein [Serratia fonticola]